MRSPVRNARGGASKTGRKAREREEIRLSENPSHLLSKEGFAMYIGKTVDAIVSIPKQESYLRCIWRTLLNQAETLNSTSTEKRGMKHAIASSKTHLRNGTTGKTVCFCLSQQVADETETSAVKQHNSNHNSF